MMIAAGAVLGAIIGSFLATLILRWPEGRSVVGGRSSCDGCAMVLSPRDLVPLMSALLLRGRCRGCGARIDPLHWRVELGCALIGACAAAVTPWPDALGWAVFAWILLTLAVLDARHFWLPDALTLPLLAAGLMAGYGISGATLTDAMIGAGAGYGALFLIACGYRLARGRDGLGLGDAKLLGAIGAWLGWQVLPLVLLIASLAGLGWAGVRAMRGEAVGGGTMMPLGTLLAVAAVPGWMLARRLAML